MSKWLIRRWAVASIAWLLFFLYQLTAKPSPVDDAILTAMLPILLLGLFFSGFFFATLVARWVVFARRFFHHLVSTLRR